MKKTILLMAMTILMVLAFSSCVYYVDRPYVYANETRKAQPYSDDENYDYNQGQATNFVILRVYDNRYVFYDDNSVIAVWIFQPNGVVIKRGAVINGLVKIFYADEMPAAEIFYKDNMRDGYSRFYHRNGRPMEFGEYRKGLRYGSWKRYNEQGTLDEEFAFNGAKVVYKLKAKANDKKKASWEFEYLNKEHEYKKQVKQDFNEKDVYPGKYKKVFGENPYDRQSPADVNIEKKDKGWKFENKDNKGRPEQGEDNSYNDNDGQRGNAYGRDKEEKDKKSFKWQNNAENREPEATAPALEITPAYTPDEKRWNNNDNNGKKDRDERGNAEPKGNAYGFRGNSQRPDNPEEVPAQVKNMPDPALAPVAVETPAQIKDKNENNTEPSETITDDDNKTWKNNKKSRIKSSGPKLDKDSGAEEVTITAKEDDKDAKDTPKEDDKEVKADAEEKSEKEIKETKYEKADSKEDDKSNEKEKSNNAGGKSRKSSDR